MVLAVLGAALTLVVALRLPETLPRARRRPAGAQATAGTYRALLADRATWGLVVAGGLVSSVIFTFVAGAPLVLQDLYGLGLTGFSVAFAAVAASLVLGTQVAAQLVGRVAPQRLALLGLVGALVAAVLPLVATAGLRGDLAVALAMVAGAALALVVLAVVVLPVLRRERRDQRVLATRVSTS